MKDISPETNKASPDITSDPKYRKNYETSSMSIQPQDQGDEELPFEQDLLSNVVPSSADEPAHREGFSVVNQEVPDCARACIDTHLGDAAAA